MVGADGIEPPTTGVQKLPERVRLVSFGCIEADMSRS